MSMPIEPTPASSALDVVTFGEAMLLLVADRPGPLEDAASFAKHTAGAETNVATGLARLGLKVGWASRLGTDMMGRHLIRALSAEGVDCSRVALTAAQPTGFMIKGRVLDDGDPPVEYHRRGSAASHMAVSDIDEAWLLSARHLHATGVFPAISATTLPLARRSMDLMRSAGRSVSFDPNLRPSLWATPAQMRETINNLAARADWVLPGLEEGRFLTGEHTAEGIAAFYRQRGAVLVVVKLGADGAWFDSASAGTGHVPALPVDKVVDTVGAGFCRRRDQRPAGGAQRSSSRPARRLDRRTRGAGAGRQRRPADARTTGASRALTSLRAPANYIGCGVGCTWPGLGGVAIGCTGSGGGTLGSVARRTSAPVRRAPAPPAGRPRARIMLSPSRSRPSEGMSRSLPISGSSSSAGSARRDSLAARSTAGLRCGAPLGSTGSGGVGSSLLSSPGVTAGSSSSGGIFGSACISEPSQRQRNGLGHHGRSRRHAGADAGKVGDGGHGDAAGLESCGRLRFHGGILKECLHDGRTRSPRL